MNGVQKKVRVLFGKLWVIHCERKTNFVILSIVRGSIVRRNLHHKISHNIENYLQWEKKIFFSSFSWELISLCELSVWRMTYLTSVYAKSCPFHGFVFSFDFFFSPGETVGSEHQVPQSPLKFATETSVFPHHSKDSIHSLMRIVLSPQLFHVFFFFALLKGSFPTQFF